MRDDKRNAMITYLRSLTDAMEAGKVDVRGISVQHGLDRWDDGGPALLLQHTGEQTITIHVVNVEAQAQHSLARATSPAVETIGFVQKALEDVRRARAARGRR